MLRISNADKYFNRYKKNKIHVINHTSISLDDKGLVALLGPSGCGKTTLLNTIGGLDKLDSGSIYINDKKISSKFMYKVDKIRNLNIGYIFQDYKLIDNLSVFDNVAFVLKMLGIKDKKEIEEKVLYVLDCVGMLRYKRRPASMLSGGERQRVGIARALVKDPNIILADEPTGNLDSKNSLEVMKIIKAISEKKLVILVTHEQSLAKFYATRIIEIEDGTITKDYVNDNVDDLDYRQDNSFYLKDFKNKYTLSDMINSVNVYSNSSDRLSLDIVIKNGNIYIRSNNKEKIEVVDEDSSIEFINGSYEKISYKNSEKYDFDFDKIKSKGKRKYASIINPFSMIIEGFRKLVDYPLLKKLLLIGFFVAGMFIMYSVSSYFATLRVNDTDFVNVDRDYLRVDSVKVNLKEYLDIRKDSDVLYVIPGSSNVTAEVLLDDYYQTSGYNSQNIYNYSEEVNGIKASLVSDIVLKKDYIIKGDVPNNSNEVVLDKLAIERTLSNNPTYKMAGIIDYTYMLNRIIIFGSREYKVVGISDVSSPNLYVKESEMIPIVGFFANRDRTKNNKDTNIYYDNIKRYTDYSDKLEIKRGRVPSNDYEVIVNIGSQELMPLNKEIDSSINGKKLVVVGYYSSKYGINDLFVNNNTYEYMVVVSKNCYMIMPKDKELVYNKYQENKLRITDTYLKSRDSYVKSRNKQNKSTVIMDVIILVISFIEIFLMIRSSFLSRIKEVGIYRAIGVKRRDICKMFAGEIFAITVIASIPGVLFMAYILKVLSSVKVLDSYILINFWTVLVSFVLVFIFNIIMGLIPVINTVRERPAVILARYDLD